MLLNKSGICLYYIKIMYVCRAVVERKGHKSSGCCQNKLARLALFCLG